MIFYYLNFYNIIFLGSYYLRPAEKRPLGEQHNPGPVLVPKKGKTWAAGPMTAGPRRLYNGHIREFSPDIRGIMRRNGHVIGKIHPG